MPYSKAHYFLIGLLVLTFMGFYQSYFGKLNDAPLAHHLHGITSTLWILLMALQSWLIHSQRRNLHRMWGKLLFVLVPLMTASFALVTWVGAQKAMGGHPFYVQFGQALLTVDVFLMLATALQVYLALRFRRNIRLHSALMFGTLIGLSPPIISRLLTNWIPAFNIEGIDTIYRFGYGLDISFVISLIIALLLFYCYRKDGWPWLLATGITIGAYVLYATVGQSTLWANVVELMAKIHPATVVAFGLLLGILSCVLGWIHGSHQVQARN